MPRPKRDLNAVPAVERIENVFWEMLEKGPYTNITIANLAHQAKVNHNTIYYYFENIDDMAAKLFHKNMQKEIPQVLLASVGSGSYRLNALLSDPQTMKKWRRARLFTQGNSAFLTNIFKQSIIEAWLAAVQVKQEDLTVEHQIELEFIFSGLVAVIANPLIGENPSLLTAMMQRNIGREILTTLQQMVDGAR